MKSRYPASFQEITTWSKEHGVLPGQARERFAQYGVLRAIANSRSLSDLLVFKGGNALDFVWMPNRSTRDLDFSARVSEQVTEPHLEKLFNGALATVSNDLGTYYRVHSVKKNPPGPNRSFPTLVVTIGYALPDDHRNRTVLQAGQPSRATITVEVSLNEPICGTQPTEFDGAHPVSVATPEDIAAEKLRALLQQIPRNRRRPQDLLDIAVMLHEKPKLDLGLIASFLLKKSEARTIQATRSAFQVPEIWERAQSGYDDLRITSRDLFIPFQEARQALLDLVSRLQIPD